MRLGENSTMEMEVTVTALDENNNAISEDLVLTSTCTGAMTNTARYKFTQEAANVTPSISYTGISLIYKSSKVGLF